MERRSGRGRQDIAKNVKTPPPPPSTGRRGTAVKSQNDKKATPTPPTRPPPKEKATPKVLPVPVPENEVPDIGGEEVVLNRRGMPQRQRKRNRFIFDDDIMVTPENWWAAGRTPKKIKSEPVELQEVDLDEDGNETVTSFLGVQNTTGGKQSSRGKPSALPSSAKSTPARQPVSSPSSRKLKEEDVPSKGKKGVRRTSTLNERSSPNSHQRGGRQPTLELLQSLPPPPPVYIAPVEKPVRGGSKSTKAPTPSPKQPTNRVSITKVKLDPDGPEVITITRKKPIDSDNWGKLVQRTENLKNARQEKADNEKSSPSKSEKKGTPKAQREQNKQREQRDSFGDVDKKPSKKDLEKRQQQEKERARLQKEKEQQAQLQKEQERLVKERKEKEKEKKAQKEKKQIQRDPITVLPPVVKLASRASAYLTEEEVLQQQHQPQQLGLSHQQLMAVIKIDDTSAQVIDKRIAHDISIRLRNLLKLPKAHKWVCYEWFYSNIDKVLFEGENDFQICLKESFPTLRARKLTRTEYTKIRRLMGKPRRCSQAFFDEEREELAKRRSKIRQIQQRKVTDFNYKELPDEIPLQLVIGTKVTARLRRPQDGLFTGTIEGVDTSNNTYRITFDRPGLGTHSIPDYEVLSNDLPETVSTSSFALKIPRRTGGFAVGTFKFQNPALLGEQPEGFPKSPFPPDGMLGGFPIRLLDMIVRLSKLLKAKREKIMMLKELNVEAEKMKSYGRPYNAEYRTRYARCVLNLDSMNKEMAMYLDGIQTYCLEIANDQGTTTQMVIPEHVLDSARQEASMVVSTYNCKANRTLVHNQKIVGLVHQLTSLLLQVRALSSSDHNLYELKSIKDTIVDVKASLEGKNLQCFQNKIEIPMNRIIAGLCVSQPKAY